MDTARCPACGAGVRPQAEWCTLCYQDLRPASQLVTANSAGVDAPLVEASLEPPSADWDGSYSDIADAEIVDAEVVDAEVVDVTAGPSGEQGTGSVAAAIPAARTSSEELHWPCVCGATVNFDLETCPDCGSAFLGDLKERPGRHRQLPALAWLPDSRNARFAVAAGSGALFAVIVTLILSLFG